MSETLEPAPIRQLASVAPRVLVSRAGEALLVAILPDGRVCAARLEPLELAPQEAAQLAALVESPTGSGVQGVARKKQRATRPAKTPRSSTVSQCPTSSPCRTSAEPTGVSTGDRAT